MARKRKKTPPLDYTTRKHQEKLNRIEPLRDNLRHYLEETEYGYFLYSPFYNGPVLDLDRCARIHEQIDRREASADDRFEAMDVEGEINLVDFQYQPRCFARDADRLPHDRYWPLLGQIYQAQKLTIHDRNLFDALFRSDRPGREHLMTPEEQAVLARLPKRLHVYRGYSGEELCADGVAWTLDRRQAVWYANWHREDDDPMVASGTVAKADIWAYLNGGDLLLPSEAVKHRRDVDAFDDTARVAWTDFLTPAFDITPMLTP